MPVRSLNSSVLKWPNQKTVDEKVRKWAEREGQRRPAVIRLGMFGSYARGDAGVGSDLDLVAVVRSADDPFELRGVSWNLTSLPVPAEILVYTDAEWKTLPELSERFARVLENETIWIYTASGKDEGG